MLGVPSQESQRSCVYMLGVPSQESQRSCVYNVRGTKPGKSEVMCLYVRGNDFASFYNYCILEMF
jgi:hypothetical protein